MRDLCISGLFLSSGAVFSASKKKIYKNKNKKMSNCDQSTVSVREQPAVRNTNAVT